MKTVLCPSEPEGKGNLQPVSQTLRLAASCCHVLGDAMRDEHLQMTATQTLFATAFRLAWFQAVLLPTDEANEKSGCAVHSFEQEIPAARCVDDHTDDVRSRFGRLFIYRLSNVEPHDTDIGSIYRCTLLLSTSRGKQLPSRRQISTLSAQRAKCIA